MCLMDVVSAMKRNKEKWIRKRLEETILLNKMFRKTQLPRKTFV